MLEYTLLDGYLYKITHPEIHTSLSQVIDKYRDHLMHLFNDDVCITEVISELEQIP